MDTLEFMLVQKAKSKGGDKYACIANPSFTIWVPQSFTRVGDHTDPHPKLFVFISPMQVKTSVDTFEFMLVQKAKSKGGDKYACISNPSFTIYVPQSFTRVGDHADPHPKLFMFISPMKVKTPVTNPVDESS